MHKPLTSWKNVLAKLGRRVNWQNFYRSRQQRSFARHQETSRLQLHVESLETRQMLSIAVVAVEDPSVVVTTTADVVDSFDGETSLREAILFANDPTASPDDFVFDLYGDGADNDTITFDSSLSGQTITLNSELPELTADATIDGDLDDDGTPDITIDGNSNAVLSTTARATRLFSMASISPVASLRLAEAA